MSSGSSVTTLSTSSSTPLQLFISLAHQPGSVWLDSSLHFGDRGRFSFIARRPSLDVSSNKGEIVVVQDGGRTRTSSRGDIFEYLETLFSCGTRFAVGYITYEATLPFLGLEKANQASPINQAWPVPEVRFLFYDSVVRFDHRDGAVSVSNPGYDDYSDVFTGHPFDSCDNDIETSEVTATMSKADYLERVELIKRHIYEGDIYQANFTSRFDIDSQSNPFLIYKRLRRLNPAPYGAYLNFGDYQVLSSSPERMFRKEGRRITTSPIKGTIERGKNTIEERANLERLLQSEKDRAELLMIVDLERNDLGKIAQIGTVSVDSIFRPETYSSLIHLVGDISAELRPEVGLPDIFRALLPGGSITGAPKKRAVEIINRLEATPRSVYTGCIGCVHGDEAEFNIAIRTIVHQKGTYLVHAGGGIVADSKPEAEYREMLLKAGNLFKALGVDPKRLAH
jgi:para-aminobenzoate synthetase component 1